MTRPRRRRSSKSSGDHAYRADRQRTKGYYGHALGASGAIEAAICALALDRGWLPPTINLERPDPSCDLDCLPGSGGGRTASPARSFKYRFGSEESSAAAGVAARLTGLGRLARRSTRGHT